MENLNSLLMLYLSFILKKIKTNNFVASVLNQIIVVVLITNDACLNRLRQ